MRIRHVLVALTCARLCEALGYEFPDPRAGECYCSERPGAILVLDPFELRLPPAKKPPREERDERQVITYPD